MSIAAWPPWVHAAAAVLMGIAAIAAWQACWWLVENPALRHFFHSFDPLCNRCFRERRLRAEKQRQRQIIRELEAMQRITGARVPRRSLRG